MSPEVRGTSNFSCGGGLTTCLLVYLSTRLLQDPMIAIIHPNTLAALGLASIIEKIMPMAEVTCFSGYAELEESEGRFFHYFISPRC